MCGEHATAYSRWDKTNPYSLCRSLLIYFLFVSWAVCRLDRQELALKDESLE